MNSTAESIFCTAIQEPKLNTMNAFVSALSTTETVTQQQREIVESSLKQFITEYSDTLTVVSAGITTESIKKVWIDSLLKLLDSDPTNAWSLDGKQSYTPTTHTVIDHQYV